MTTTFKSQPGFFSADTAGGKVLIHVVQVSTYELENTALDLQTEFPILAAVPSLMAERGEKEQAVALKRLLRQLGQHIASNAEHLQP